MSEDYAGAASDLSAWYISKEGNAGTAESIAAAYDTSITADLTEEIAWLVKLARRQSLSRIQSLLSRWSADQPHACRASRSSPSTHRLQRHRWDDIRRFGIEIKHSLADGTVMTLKVDDHRRARNPRLHP